MMIGNVKSRTLVDDPANITPSYNQHIGPTCMSHGRRKVSESGTALAGSVE